METALAHDLWTFLLRQKPNGHSREVDIASGKVDIAPFGSEQWIAVEEAQELRKTDAAAKRIRRSQEMQRSAHSHERKRTLLLCGNGRKRQQQQCELLDFANHRISNAGVACELASACDVRTGCEATNVWFVIELQGRQAGFANGWETRM